MIFRIFPNKDTTITNLKIRGVSQSGSNLGRAESLRLFKLAALTGSTTDLSRLLVQFDLSSIASLTASLKAPASGIKYSLNLKNEQHACTLPSSYTVQTQAVSQPWGEGVGLDQVNYRDRGFANWVKPTSVSYWSASGAVGTGPAAYSYFDQGDEDLSVDVTSIVNNWLTGGTTNNGFLINLSGTHETDGLDYYLKMFYSRQTSELDKRPYLEATWDDSIKDDRNNFAFNHTGTLYLYNSYHGILEDITGLTGPNCLSVSVSDASGTLFNFSGSYTGLTGIYSCSFSIPSASYSGSLFHDTWYLGNNVYLSGNFGISGDFSKSSLRPKKYYVNVVDLQDEYERDDHVLFSVFVRDWDYNPAVVLTASSDSHGIVMTKAYYRITNDHTDEIVVPFGTGSESTRLSYDRDGNYFKFYMSSLSPGEVYRISFLFDVDGQKRVIDDGFRFRIR